MKRPQYLQLPLNRKPLHLLGKDRNRCFLGCLIKFFIFLMRGLHLVFIGRRSMTNLFSRTKTRFFAVMWFIFCALLLMRLCRDARSFWNSYSSVAYVCFPKDKVYVDGRLVCSNKQGRKYLSYQPPGGGWNNQRIAFENAVVFAKLLNRTLIVHPLAPHQEILRLKKQGRISAGYEIYNMLSEEMLLPLSKVIDLKLLSRLIPVIEVTSSHATFLDEYKNLKWRRVCHNGLLGIWVDFLPETRDKSAWKLLQRRMEASLPARESIPLYRRVCRDELKRFSARDRPVWSIARELSNRNEDIVYFAEGSLYIRELLFFDEKTVRETHEWIMRYVHFAPEIWRRVLRVLKEIGSPFSAIHVRRTDHPSSFRMTQDFWLQNLKVRGALNLSDKLYVSTDESNKTWFEPFREAGYHLLFADDFQGHLQRKDVSAVVAQDILGLCEQLICAHADHFVGSYYSTFTMFIQRLRKQLTWNGGPIRKPYTSITWVGSIETIK